MIVSAPSEPVLAVPDEYPSNCYNEVYDASGQVRPAWKNLVSAAHRSLVSEFEHRSQQANQLIAENDVTFNVFHDGTTSQRPWQLDLLPFVLDAQEWRTVEAGLIQRARLLDWIVKDCHGLKKLIHRGVIPPEVLFANPGFCRQFCGLHSDEPSIVAAAFELARDPSGQWHVMADRAEAPAGAAFALENRIVTSRTIPSAFQEQPVQRLAPYFLRVQNTLKRLGSRLSENPRIVLLSPGSRYSYYFEDVYLARYLGYSLVEGADLAVRDNRVYLKTLAGLVPIDVIVSRGIERGIDPLELGGGEPHGVPGLLRVAREGRVVLANVPGSGLVESPIFMAFLPKICRELFAEELKLPSIETWWCGDPDQWRYVRDHLDHLVIKPAFLASGNEEVILRNLTADQRTEFLQKVADRPQQYVAQSLIQRSAAPAYFQQSLGIGHIALRTFLIADDREYAVMPGGLARVAQNTDPMELSISAGVTSKDVWVNADGPVEPVSLLTSQDQPVPLRRTSAVFPSRVADDLFWFGQSLDRIDFLGRLLRSVVERLASEVSADSPELPSLVRALTHEGQIEASYAIQSLSTSLPDLAAELPRMVSDVHESRGLTAAVSEMHRLAALERLWISPDTFRKVRETVDRYQASAAAGWSGLVDLLAAINHLILDLAAISGLIHDGMIRGPAWRVMDLGRRIERIQDTSRFLRSVLWGKQKVERSVLRAVLEVMDCRMTYRARYLDNVQQNAVLDLCITDETCPRSIAFQLSELAEHVDALPGHEQALLRTEEKRVVMAATHVVRMISAEQLAEGNSEVILGVLDRVEGQMKHLSDLLTRKYLLHSGIPRQFNSEFEVFQ